MSASVKWAHRWYLPDRVVVRLVHLFDSCWLSSRSVKTLPWALGVECEGDRRDVPDGSHMPVCSSRAPCRLMRDSDSECNPGGADGGADSPHLWSSGSCLRDGDGQAHTWAVRRSPICRELQGQREQPMRRPRGAVRSARSGKAGAAQALEMKQVALWHRAWPRAHPHWTSSSFPCPPAF